MRGSRFRVLYVLLLVFLQLSAQAQEFSERQEIAVFRLSYYGQPVVEPPASLRVEVRGRRSSLTVELRGTGKPRDDQLFIRALGAVDERIRGVFVNLARFDIIGMSQRLTAGSVDDFIDVLTEYKRSRTELPEAVLLGEQAFTQRDFQQLVGTFVVVVPAVSWYSLTRNSDGVYRAEIETSFTFINVENLTTFEQFFITTTGTDAQAESAVREAVDAISSELTFRVRSMPEFQIKTGILEVNGREVILEFGRNMGLRPGDEYAIVSTRVTSTGHLASTDTGLIVISDVQEEFSVGQVLYANPRAMVGDQLREVPRRGIEIDGYVDAVTDGIHVPTYAVGVRGVASRGFYTLRPFAAVELPFHGLIGTTPALLPMNVLGGAELNFYFGRLMLTPGGAVGLGGAVPLDGDSTLDTFYLTHLGFQARMTGSVLVTPDIRLFVEAGLAWWIGLYESPLASLSDAFASYGGLLVGGGITFK